MGDPFALAGLIASISSLILVSRITVSRAGTDDVVDLRRELAELRKDVAECKQREVFYHQREAEYQRQINRLMRQALNLPEGEEPI